MPHPAMEGAVSKAGRIALNASAALLMSPALPAFETSSIPIDQLALQIFSMLVPPGAPIGSPQVIA